MKIEVADYSRTLLTIYQSTLFNSTEDWEMKENSDLELVTWRKEAVPLQLVSYLWVLHPVAHLSNWFLMMPSIATKFQYVNSPFFIFLLTHYMFRSLRALLSLITCIGDHGSKYRYRHITSIRQVVYVQWIRCSKNSPLKHLIVYLIWRWPVGAETCSEWEGK
jgi:hypothetical protein